MAGAADAAAITGTAHAAPFVRVRRETVDPALPLASEARAGALRGEDCILQSKSLTCVASLGVLLRRVTPSWTSAPERSSVVVLPSSTISDTCALPGAQEPGTHS